MEFGQTALVENTEDTLPAFSDFSEISLSFHRHLFCSAFLQKRETIRCYGAGSTLVVLLLMSQTSRLTRWSWAETACRWLLHQQTTRAARWWVARDRPWSLGCSGSLAAGPLYSKYTSSTRPGWEEWNGSHQTAPEHSSTIKLSKFMHEQSSNAKLIKWICWGLSWYYSSVDKQMLRLICFICSLFAVLKSQMHAQNKTPICAKLCGKLRRIWRRRFAECLFYTLKSLNRYFITLLRYMSRWSISCKLKLVFICRGTP